MSVNASGQKNAIKRIYNDLKENSAQPIDGIQIYIPDDENLFKLHCQIKIMFGVYKDIHIHAILHIPPSYPIIGPAMNICDDFTLPGNFHHHILGKSICNDMLTNFKSFFEVVDGGKELKKASGWSAGYTLNVILSQMQIFFSDPDMKVTLTKQEILNLIAYSNKYSCKNCKNKTQFCAEDKEVASATESKLARLKESLICGLTKSSFLSDETMILGYPILLHADRFHRLWPQILIELISYNGYMMQVQELEFSKLENFDLIKMFSPNGELYNYWIPCYFTEDHFRRNYQLILNSVSVIKNGISGARGNDFKPEVILDVLPCLINKTIVFILNGTIFHSLAAIQAYCHMLRLYCRLLNRFPQLKNAIELKVRQFKSSSTMRSKSHFPDLGEFIINLFLSQFEYDNIKLELYREFMARQIFWIEKSGRLEQIESSKLMDTVFSLSKIANQLLMFNIQAAKCFVSTESIKQMDENMGFIGDTLMAEFKSSILRIKNVTTYAEFFSEIKISEYSSEQSFKDMLFECKKVAFENKYIR